MFIAEDCWFTRTGLAPAAGGQLRSCSGNNYPPAHLPSIGPDPAPIRSPNSIPNSIRSNQSVVGPPLPDRIELGRPCSSPPPRRPSLFHAVRSDGSELSTPLSEQPDSQEHPRRGVLFLPPLLTAAPAMAAGVGSALRRLYLSVYNWVVFVGWSVAPFPCSSFVACFPGRRRIPLAWPEISLDLGGVVLQGAGAVLRGFDAVGERAWGRLRRRRAASAVRADRRRHGGQLLRLLLFSQ